MLTHEDFRRLKEGEWLNCKLLEAYFYLVCQDCLKRGICVKTLSSHFWSQFVTKGYEAAKHWIAKEHLFTYDVIFTLICAGGNHWTLMVRISVCIIEKLMCILPYSGNLL